MFAVCCSPWKKRSCPVGHLGSPPLTLNGVTYSPMDKYTNAVISFLEKHQAVGNVKFTPQEPCSSADIYSWESRNSPYKYVP